jgi:hypothetical protein
MTFHGTSKFIAVFIRESAIGLYSESTESSSNPEKYFSEINFNIEKVGSIPGTTRKKK